MGSYNPHQPYILGQEWVPIRNKNLVYSPAVNSIELGTRFTLATSRQVRNARFYLNTPQATPQGFQTALVNIYPAGTEDQTGPIREIIIPVNSGATTGTGIILFGASTVTEAVYQPGDGKYIEFDPNSNVPQNAGFFFAVNAYPELGDKRILNVSLLYSGFVRDQDASGNTIDFVDPTPSSPLTIIRQTNDAGTNQGFTADTFLANTGTLQQLATSVANATFTSAAAQVIGVLDLGDVNNFWDSAGSPSNDLARMPWRYVDLQKFEATAGTNRQYLKLVVQIPDHGSVAYPFLALEYMALRVLYCEEKRVVYGGNRFGYSYGMNAITLRNTSFTADPILPAGDYLPTLSWVSPGSTDYGQNSLGDFPDLNAIQELYQIPSHPATQVNVPFPLAERIGEVFTGETTHLLPQLSLHASGGTLTEPHSYGRQAWARVYGSNTATQEIYDDISGVAASYPQVRFYARRFGDTTIPLTLTGVAPLAGSTVSITVADFDALPEIIDGAREVTLRFASPPSMGTVAGNPAWVWSAAGETAGNHWEILAASAPAISGVPGSLYTLVPAPNQLGTATYQPPAGDTVELTWMPQGVASPWVTGASADSATDAVLIFSQDPATVTGLGLSQLTQVVTGIGLNCGDLPCCIPSGIGYQRITWSANTLPPTGFGAYELQRFDPVTGGDFQTIMLATNQATLAFNDFEARVGAAAVYRIRALNALNFAGLWSTYVSGTPASPGVTGGCSDSTGALIFTSNADQSGASNAAYVMQWDSGMPTEAFTLPEADQVQFQPMFGRNGSIAFHGTERGLETFERDVLLQAAAISPIRLADAKTLRDLAWAQLPYVCVRDDIGDRWYSNVRVPTVAVRNNRASYMARLQITETTQTPYPVNP